MIWRGERERASQSGKGNKKVKNIYSKKDWVIVGRTGKQNTLD